MRGSCGNIATIQDDVKYRTLADQRGRRRTFLVIVKPSTNPNLNNATSWRPSSAVGGAPGVDDRVLYAAWKTMSFSVRDAANNVISGPTADPDLDGCPNLLEYARGTDPMTWAAAPIPAFTMEPLTIGGNTQEYAVVRFRYRPSAEDAVLTAAISTDLTTWSSGGLVSLGSTDQGDTVTAVFRSG